MVHKAVFLIALAPPMASAFAALRIHTPSIPPASARRGCVNNKLAASTGSDSEGRGSPSPEGREEGNAPELLQNKYSVGRAGGRKPRPRRVTKEVRTGDEGSLISAFRKYAIPLIIAAFIIKLLLGIFGGNSNPGVVYYSRSVYESRTYTQDGNVKTTRKEDFQSNIPELVKQAREYSQNQNGGGSSIDSADEELIEIEKAMDSFLLQKW